MILEDGHQVDDIIDYLWYHSGDGCDAESGNVDAPTGWFARMGKWIIQKDGDGNGWENKYADEHAALVVFNDLDDQYVTWTMDAACNVCDATFDSEEGACWTCGARSWRSKEATYYWAECTGDAIKARLAYRRFLGLEGL